MSFDISKSKSKFSTLIRTATAEELSRYEQYKLYSIKNKSQEASFALIKLGNKRTDESINILNRDNKMTPERPAIRNKVSKRNLFK